MSPPATPGTGKRPTQNAEAYQDYLRGRYYASRYTGEGFQKALMYFQSAIDADPNYALAYSGLADCYYAASNLLLPPREAMAKAKAAASKSVVLDSSLSAAYVSLGLVASKFDWNWDEAEKNFQKGLSLIRTPPADTFGTDCFAHSLAIFPAHPVNSTVRSNWIRFQAMSAAI